MKSTRYASLPFGPLMRGALFALVALISFAASIAVAAPAASPAAATPVSAQAQAIDPFYSRLLDAGREAYSRGNYQETIDNLKIAFFGYLDHPAQLLECYIYLQVCHFELRDLDNVARYRNEIQQAKLDRELAKLALPKALVDRYREINAALDRVASKTPSLSLLSRPMPQEDAPAGKPGTKPAGGTGAAGQSGATSGAPPTAAGGRAAASVTASPNQNWDDEIARLTGVLAANPKNADAAFLLSSIYVERKKLKDAHNVLDRLAAAAPKNGNVWVEIGKLYEAEKKPKEALAAIERAAGLLPDNIEVLYTLGGLYYGQGAFDQAKAAFFNARRIAPDYKDLGKYLALLDEHDIALALATERNLELARKATGINQKAAYYGLALRKAPGNANVALEFAGAYMAVKRPADAAKVLEPLVKARTGDIRVYLATGEAYIADRSYGKAVVALTAGIAAARETGTGGFAGPIEIRYMMAQAYMADKKFRDAIDELDIVQAQDPGYRDSALLRQQCLARIKK